MSAPVANSRLMVGSVDHRRFTPKKHYLRYPLFMPAIDLDELEQLKQSVWGFGDKWWHWARFQRTDYLGQGDLKLALQNKVHELTGDKLTGKVIAVCHLRYLGIYFSPVNFYYLYDKRGQWQYLLAEVSNTPWNERHYYAVNAQSGNQDENWQHDKAFHVSPFNPIDQQYKWKLKPLGERLFVHLACHRDHKEFDATVSMKSQPFCSKQLLSLLIKTPVMAVKVVAGIYWHAFKLWCKGMPIYDHPEKKSSPAEALSQQNSKD
ncbi:DUF1365 domain-containing protein [Vibrio nomapromontoriensis]|uniref:DUF1365 domain-containing protein n=1 Tax=Vibrio nomapromontoriensis TaxID=2910246 RepID=UPI003D1516D4